MKTQEQVKKFSEKKFKRTFGVDRHTCFQSLKNKYRIAHKKGGRRSKLTVFDRLCIFFAYYRDYRTFDDIANDYNVAASTAFDAISLVEDTLNKSGKFTLPKLEKLVKNPTEMVVIDTTEVEKEAAYSKSTDHNVL